MNEAESTPKSDKNQIKIAALLVACIASFFTPFMGSSINIALPTIGADFGADAVLLNWVTNGFLLAAAIFAVPFGRIADIHGMKKIFTYGMIIFTIASLLCALSPNTLSLIGSRVLQGIGTAMIFVPSRGGISHSPREFTADDDLVAGARVLLDVVQGLASPMTLILSHGPQGRESKDAP